MIHLIYFSPLPFFQKSRTKSKLPYGWLETVPLTGNTGHMYEDASSDLAPFKCNFYINLCYIWEKGSSGRNWRPGQCMNANINELAPRRCYQWTGTPPIKTNIGTKILFKNGFGHNSTHKASPEELITGICSKFSKESIKAIKTHFRKKRIFRLNTIFSKKGPAGQHFPDFIEYF